MGYLLQITCAILKTNLHLRCSAMDPNPDSDSSLVLIKIDLYLLAVDGSFASVMPLMTLVA